MDVLNEIPLGTEGWNAILTSNFQILEDGLLSFINDTKEADAQIKGSVNDDSVKALEIKNSDGTVVLSVSNAVNTAIDDAVIVTTESAGASYTSTEQDMLNHLKTDVTDVKDQLNLVLGLLRNMKILPTP